MRVLVPGRKTCDSKYFLSLTLHTDERDHDDACPCQKKRKKKKEKKKKNTGAIKTQTIGRIRTFVPPPLDQPLVF
jgi:hypothetical protein